MKQRLLALLVGLLAVVAVISYLNFRGEDEIHDLPPLTPPSGESVARGAYLVRVGNCMTCHTARGGAPFAGGRAIETPFGTVYASNITPHNETGIGRWSADHFWRALHNGRARDGRLLYPAFPYPNYTLVARADSDTMYHYLRSVTPVEQPNAPHRLRWPYSTQAALAVWRALYFSPGQHQQHSTQSAQWNRGSYLVRSLGHCNACHTARNVLGATSDLLDLSGGLIPMQNWYAPSLTSPTEAGVADWELAHIERLLQSGIAPRGTVLGPMAEVVMQSTQYLAPEDVRAMAVFLKALPQSQPGTPAEGAPAVLRTMVEYLKALPQSWGWGPAGRGPAISAATVERGSKLYGQHCAQCHGEKGEGVPGAYPPLAANRAVNLPVVANLVQVVLNGGFAPATAGNPRPFGMPPYATVLSDSDIAAVLSHIRASWGNSAAPVSELAVSRQRGTGS